MYAHAQAPVRIGIAGGGTDLPVWTRERLGRCLSLAVKMYVHAVAITRPDKKVVASYRKLDTDSCATEIGNGLIRESALLHGFLDGFEVHTLSEITSRGSGLGVSSAIAVALAACFSRMKSLRGDLSTPDDPEGFAEVISRAAWEVEIGRLRRPIGRQDHMAAAFGGLRLYQFPGADAFVDRTFSSDDASWVADHLALVELPGGHDSRAILSEVVTADQLEAAAEAVPVALRAIDARDLGLLGQAIGLGYASKLRIPGAVPKSVAEAVSQITACEGVRGCKVAGAGGGGHLVVACSPDTVARIHQVTGLRVFRVQADVQGVRSDGCI